MKKIDELSVEYRVLSQMTDYFPKNSNHKCAQAIGIRMNDVLKEIKDLEQGVEQTETIALFNPYPEQLHDKDGYPTQEALDYLKNWWRRFDNGAYVVGEFSELTKANVSNLMAYVTSLWYFDDWGVIHDPRKRSFELHTGGWSGNEEIMEYFEKTQFACFYWQMKRVGGHYFYEY